MQGPVAQNAGTVHRQEDEIMNQPAHTTPSAPNNVLPDNAFRTVADLVRQHAQDRPTQLALVQGDTTLTYSALNTLIDRVAAALQREGVQPGETR